jgi:hypothetical protein
MEGLLLLLAKLAALCEPLLRGRAGLDASRVEARLERTVGDEVGYDDLSGWRRGNHVEREMARRTRSPKKTKKTREWRKAKEKRKRARCASGRGPTKTYQTHGRRKWKGAENNVPDVRIEEGRMSESG